MQEMDILRQPALGRIAELGTLYNIEHARFLSCSGQLKFLHQMSCIQVDQQEGTYFQPIYNDTFCEKFRRFIVLPELQLHILGRVLEVKGSGLYLRAEKNSARAVRVGLLCTVTTKTVKLQVNHPEFLKSIFEMKHFAELVSQNNYVVSKILYGGMMVVSVEDCNEDERDITKVTRELITLLESLAEVFREEKPLSKLDFAHAENLSWTVYSDFVERSIPCPTVHGVYYQFENLMQSLKWQTRGQGIPIHYTMLPLRHCLNIAQPPFIPRFSKIQAKESDFFVRIFDSISVIKQHVSDVYNDVGEYRWGVTNEDFGIINNLQNKCQATYTKIWEGLANALLRDTKEVRLHELQHEFSAKGYHLPNCNLEMSPLQRIREKNKLLGVMKKKGVEYCKEGRSYKELISSSYSDCYILRCSTNARFSQSNFQDNLDAFLNMIDDESHCVKGALFVFADHDFDSNASNPYRANIRHVKKGVVISKDMLADRLKNDEIVSQNEDRCIAACSGSGIEQMKSSCHPSIERFPKSFSGKDYVSTSAVDDITQIKKLCNSRGTQKPENKENTNKKVQDKTSTAVKEVANNLNENNILYPKNPSIGNGDSKMRSIEEGKKPENHAIKSEQQPHPQEKGHKMTTEWTVVLNKPKGNVGRDGIPKTGVQRANSCKLSLVRDKRNDNSCSQRNVSQVAAVQSLKKDATVIEQPIRGRKTSLEGQPRSNRDTSYKLPNDQVSKSRLTEKYPCPPSEQFEDAIVGIQHNSSKTINILIMGESGVGKSTWINGVANYVKYSTVEEAVRSKAVYVINSSFLLTDDDFKEIVVRMGPDGDRKSKLGTSTTQFPQSYEFFVGGRNVRLIDTPGIGDTRGVDKDQENFQNIFSHLSQFKNIHGICILLKPNSARMNTAFQFCIKELLAHLHKDACKNIVFVFTNSRGTFYRPGDTFPTLSNLLKENKGMDIPLENERVYCMDNEPVRFLAATQQGMAFNDRDKVIYAHSWEVSRAETDRLITYVSNLEPHDVKQSLHLNEITRFSIETAEPFVAVAKELQVRIGRVRKRLDKVTKTKLIENEQKLPSKMIVCCNTQCRRANQQDGNSGKYSCVCHHPCRHNIQPIAKVGNKDVKDCEVMDIKNGNCTKCDCKWLMHMCINKELGTGCDRESRYVKNQSISAENKGPSEDDRELVRLQTNLEFEMQNRAKLGVFLKQNTIGASSDVTMDQLERTIEKEQELMALGGDVKHFEALTKVLAMYRSEAKSLENEMLQNHQSISFSDIRQSFGHQ